MDVLDVIIISIVFICTIITFRNKRDKKKIEKRVREMDGENINIEWRFLEKGPFRIAGRGTMVYKFTYTVKQNGKDVRKEGWVKTGGLFGDDWRF